MIWNLAVQWSAVPGAAQYRLQRSLDGSFYGTIAILPRTTLSFVDVGVPEGTDLYYKLIADNSVGSSIAGPPAHWTHAAATAAPTLANLDLPPFISSPVAVSITWVPSLGVNDDVAIQIVERSLDGTVWDKISGSLPPSASSFLDLTPILPAVHVSWNPVPLAAQYRVQRSSDYVTWATLGTITAPTASFTDISPPLDQYSHYRVIADNSIGSTTGPSSGIYVAGRHAPGVCISYIYRIATLNSVGETAGSQASITTNPPVLGILVTATENPLQNKLTFNAPSGLVPPYQIYRALEAASLTAYTQTHGAEYIDTALVPGGKYFYRVSSGIWTGPIVGIYAAGPVKPGAPTVQIDPLLPYVDIFWLPSYGATSYGIERSIDGGLSYQSLAAGLVGAFYVDSSPPMGNATQPIRYRIRASDTLYSIVSDDTTINLPVAPPPVPVLSCLSGGIQAAWTGQAGSTGYDLQRSATKLLADWATIASPSPVVGAMSYLDTTAATYQRYYYRLVNKGSGGTKQGGLASSIVYKAPGSAPGYRIVLNGVDVSDRIERGSNIRMNDEVTQKGAVASFRLVFDGAAPKILTR